MNTKLAEELFHGTEGYNCAQAVYKAFQKTYNVSDLVILEAKKKGGGRAEDGICGALYAALKLTDDKLLHQKLITSFKTEGGSIRCKDIRSANKINCKQCVKLAAAHVKGFTTP